jgi:hypothetical protein
MATQINIAEAKAKLSSLLDRALAGEDIVIARRANRSPGWFRSPGVRGASRGWWPRHWRKTATW